MKGKMLAAALLGATALSPLGYAQELQVGSNAYVDMYFADWHASKGQTTGPVTEYAVFTKGDPIKPTTKGAILRYVDSYVYATLAPSAVGATLNCPPDCVIRSEAEGSAVSSNQSVRRRRNMIAGTKPKEFNRRVARFFKINVGMRREVSGRNI